MLIEFSSAGAISLFLNITGAIAPMAPVLNTPLLTGITFVKELQFEEMSKRATYTESMVLKETACFFRTRALFSRLLNFQKKTNFILFFIKN